MTRLLFLISTLCLFSSIAIAGIGEYEVSYDMAYSGPEVLGLMVVPDGSGPDFTEAQSAYSGTFDASISLLFLDGLGIPVSGFPAEDMWLVSDDSGMVSCPGGTIADGPTNATGQATFSRAMKAGGWSNGLTLLVVNGAEVYTQPGVALHINSPDINGDLLVNLSDVQLFAGDFYGSYHFRSDLAFDNVINLSDIVPLSRALGATCP